MAQRNRSVRKRRTIRRRRTMRGGDHCFGCYGEGGRRKMTNRRSMRGGQYDYHYERLPM